MAYVSALVAFFCIASLAWAIFREAAKAPLDDHPLCDFEVSGLAPTSVRAWYDSALRRFLSSGDEGAAAEFEAALDHVFHARGPLDFEGRIMEGKYVRNGSGFTRVDGAPEEWADTMGRPMVTLPASLTAAEEERTRQRFVAVYGVPNHAMGALVLDAGIKLHQAGMVTANELRVDVGHYAPESSPFPMPDVGRVRD